MVQEIQEMISGRRGIGLRAVWIGMELGMSCVLGGFLGYLIGSKFSTGLGFAGLGLGLFLGFWGGLYAIYKSMVRK